MAVVEIYRLPISARRREESRQSGSLGVVSRGYEDLYARDFFFATAGHSSCMRDR